MISAIETEDGTLLIVDAVSKSMLDFFLEIQDLLQQPLWMCWVEKYCPPFFRSHQLSETDSVCLVTLANAGKSSEVFYPDKVAALGLPRNLFNDRRIVC